MQFLKNIFFIAAALASFASADNTVTFVNQDGQDRTILFTPASGGSAIDNLEVGGWGTETATFPLGWSGNFISVMKGGESKNGMLAEVTFNAWEGMTFFDVSAIVAPEDTSQIKELFPVLAQNPLAGCQDYPCNNAYNQPDDIMTKATQETDFICLIGNLVADRRRGVVARNVADKKVQVASGTGEVTPNQ